MAEAPAGGAGAKLDPQAAIAKQAAITQSGAGGDAAIISRIENAIKNSPMGWLQAQLGEVGSRAASEQGEVGSKVQEHQQLIATNQADKDKPKDAGPPPAPGPAAHPAVPHPTAAGAAGAAPAVHAAPAGGGAAPAHAAPVSAPPKAAAPAAAPAHAPAPTIAASIAGVGGDSQLDAILNAYTPKGQQSTQMLGRVKQMGDIAQGFNGQLDVYVAQGGAVEHGIAAASNFFGMGKDVSAVWANNPYRKVHGILGGIMTGLSAVKSVCSVVGNICGKLGLVLTVIGLLGMIFPPIGAAVSGIARILNVVGVICDAVSFVLSGILTGLNGVVLAQQINAGASAEEKAATADLMMSEANETASGFVNLAMMFGPKFMKGMLGNSKGIIGSLMRRAKATIGRVSLKLTADIKHFANRITRRLGFGGAAMSRVGGAWKDTGFFARTKERFAQSSTGKTFFGAPQHLEAMQEKLMAKYGNTGWAKKLDRVGAWSGSVAQKFDLEEKVGKLGEKSGSWVGSIGADTKFGQSMAAAADRSERQTRELAMKMDARNAADLEKSRWHNYLDQRQADNPEHLRDKKTEKEFIHGQGEKVKAEHTAAFEHQEGQRDAKERLEGLRDQRYERKNEEYYSNKHGERDEIMGSVHGTREKRYQLEGQFAAQETERKTLLAKTTKTAEEQTRLTQLNTELRTLDEARRLNRMYETELQGIAGGTPVRKPEYRNWGDVATNVADAALPVAEMLHLKEEDAAWAASEKASVRKQAKYSKGSAQGNAAGRGGHGTFEEIASEGRHEQMADFTQFVRSNQQASTVSGKVRGMLSGVLAKPAAPAPAAAPTMSAAPTATATAAPTATAPAAPTATVTATPAAPTVTATPAAPTAAATPAAPAAPTTTATAAPAAGSHGGPHGGVSVGPGAPHAPGADTTVALAASVQHEPPPAPAAPAGPQADAAGADDNAAEVLPYWPALVPEFDKASHDFDWMRRVAVEFKKAQIDGKQKAVDTLAVYGRYQEYAKLRAAAAQKNQQGAAQTGTAIQQNVDHAGQTQAQAGQGEGKQNEAKGAASNKAATDLPEPESRGFWGRILGAVKRWAKNKAAQVFGWIQEKIASVILKGLCGVSMGDMREYAGALRRQQASAHGVADGAGKTSAQAQQSQIKLSADATKEAQGAADAIGECDRNITDADGFMADIVSFEQQLVEEKAHAQAFIAQIHAATHAEQARQQQEAAAHAQEEKKREQMSAQAGGQDHEHAAPAAAPAPDPTPTPAAGGEHKDDHHEQHHDTAVDANATGEIAGAAIYVGTEGESMVSRLEARADDYHSQLAIALTNHTGKDKAGVDLKGPAKTESKHIVEEFKDFTTATKHSMDGFTSMSIDPSQARHIAETIVQAAEQLEHNFGHSQAALDELFERTYNGIREGKRTLKSQVLDGDNAVGRLNHAGDNVSNTVIDTTLPAANTAWSQVAAPIQVAPAAAPSPAGGGGVQRKSTGVANTGAPKQVAEQGVAGASEQLPHSDAIQRSFGAHDISHVRSQTGGTAADAAGELGARAYAVGDRVGFAQSPDLHTAAHEAAHVVQQHQGVQLKGGIDGGAGDPHEQQADAVADKVVRGESAEGLLGAPTKARGVGGVQRKDTASLVPATRYLELNDKAAGEAIVRHLQSITPPQPHPRLHWKNLNAFYKRLGAQLDYIIFVFDKPIELAQLVYPQDPYATVDSMRPIAGRQQGHLVGTWDWQPSIGIALGEMIEEALVTSLYRLGPRWLQIAELAGGVSGSAIRVDPDAIPRSHSMDRAVAPAMCQAGVFDVVADTSHAKTSKRTSSSNKHVDTPVGVGLRPVTLKWLGSESRELWNWVRAVSPTDATVEEVSATLFNDTAEAHNEKHGDYLAFAMTAAPPLFGLPGHWAKRFDEAAHFAPEVVSAQTDETESNLVVLAGSSAADDQALVEAGVHVDTAKPDKHKQPTPTPARGSWAAVTSLVEDVMSQVTYLQSTLGSWQLSEPIASTFAFLARRRKELADPSTAAKWKPVLEGQKANLSRIGSGIVEIDRSATTMGIKDKHGADAKPLHEILRFYADAAGTSHLLRTSETLIQRAAAQQSTLALRGVQSTTRDLNASADMLRETAPAGDDDRNRLSRAAVMIDEDSRKLQSRMMRGEKVDSDEVDHVTLNAGEISLKSKVHAVGVQLGALEQAAHDAGDGFFAAIASLFSGDFRGLENATSELKGSLEMVTRDMDWQSQSAGLSLRVENQKDLDDYNREMIRVRKEALAQAQQRFASIAGNNKIQDFLQKGASLVKWQSFRTACVKLAALIGVSIIGGAIGGMVARGVGGLFMGSAGVATMEELGVGAQMIARGSSLVTETAVTSVGQAGIMGDNLSDAFLENMLMNVGSGAVLKALEHQAAELEQIERVSKTFWEKAAAGGKIVLRESAAITGHAIMGVALGYVAHKIVTGKTQPPPETIEEWLLQGAAIAVGRYVGKAMEARHASFKKLAGIKGFDRGPKLLAAGTELQLRATRIEQSQHPQGKEAAELLSRRHEVLNDELAALDELSKSPEKEKAAGLKDFEIRQMRFEINAQLNEVHERGFAETPFHLAGLEELIPGAQWKGTHEQIVDAVASSKRSGVNIDAKPPTGNSHSWHIELEGRPLEVIERETPVAQPKQHADNAHPASAEPVAGHPDHATKTGAGAQKPTADAETHRVLEDHPAASARTKAAVDAMDATTRTQYEKLVMRAETPGQRVMLERGLAAGHSLAELDMLRAAMSGMSDAEVAKNFSGHGIVQLYQQSCVPTAYEIALADVDPVYAFELRNHPEKMMQQQRDALVKAGGAQTQRTDVQSGKNVPAAVKEQLNDPGMNRTIKDPNMHSPKGSPYGIETTEMVGQPLHEQLEKATGVKYEVITNSNLPYAKPGQGQFQGGVTPHDRINAALDAHLPVIFGGERPSGHAQVIVGKDVAADGKVYYHISDPMSGTTARLPSDILDLLGVQSITVPKLSVTPHEPVTASHGTTGTGSTLTGGGGGDHNRVAEFIKKMDPAIAPRARAVEAQLAHAPSVMSMIETHSFGAFEDFAAKSGLGPEASVPLLNKLLEAHPGLSNTQLREFGVEIHSMTKTRKTCSNAAAIEGAIDLSALPRYSGRATHAVADLRLALGDNIDLPIAMKELVRETYGPASEVAVAGEGVVRPDIKMTESSAMGPKRVGREMEAVGAQLKTPKTADAATAKADLHTGLSRAVRDKAMDYMKRGTENFDSQEIVIQVRPSEAGYDYDHLLSKDFLETLMPRAFASDQYKKAVTKANERVKTDHEQPKVKTPDRVRFYDSKGNLVYEWTSGVS